MKLNLLKLMNEEACYEYLREICWADGVKCPHCNHSIVIKNGKNGNHSYCQKYKCNGCHQGFDDLTGTLFSGSKKALKVWIVCLYLMSLNISNVQIGKELDITESTAVRMTKLLREAIAKKKLIYNLQVKLKPMKST